MRLVRRWATEANLGVCSALTSSMSISSTLACLDASIWVVAYQIKSDSRIMTQIGDVNGSANILLARTPHGHQGTQQAGRAANSHSLSSSKQIFNRFL